ncbi:RloB domain-containing protein [Candidatus Parcubacteria bacterium]|nr:RloB domain-containing protein [Candidatus Parcubacteria bacterium]
MSRTNPYKRKIRYAKKTAFFYCEGRSEKAFLRHIKSIYNRNSGVAVTIDQNGGGNPDDIVGTTIKIVSGRSDDYSCVIFDSDKILETTIRKDAKSKNILLIENNPCLEAFLMSILEDKNFSFESSSWYKREFEKKYISKSKRGDKRSYEKIFPKKLLNKKRKEIGILDKIIGIMEGKI